MGFVNDSGVAFWLSKLKQTDYLTKIGTADANWQKFVTSDRSLAAYTVNTSNNKGFATGVLDPTENFLNFHTVTKSLPFQLSSYWLGYFLHKIRGTVSTSQPDATNAAAVRRSLFARQDLATDPAARVIGFIERVGNHNVHYPSMAVTRLQVSVDNEQRITSSVDLVGSGERITPSGVSSLPEQPAALKHFYGSDCNLILGDGVDPDINAGIAGRLVSQSLSLSAPIAEDDMRPVGGGRYQVADTPESGAIGSQALITDMAWELQFALRLDSAGDPFFAWLQQQTDLSAKFQFNGPTIATVAGSPPTVYRHSALFQFDKCRISNVQIQSRNNLLVAAITAVPLYDFTNSRDALIRLDNETTSYTV
jgi:hypothetical protein